MNKWILWVFLAYTNTALPQMYIKTFGTRGIDDGPTCMVRSEKGFVIAGYENDVVYFVEVDLLGNLLWKKNYDFTAYPDYITDIKISPEGILYGCGYGRHAVLSSFSGFYFTYDLTKQEFIWIQSPDKSIKPSNIHKIDAQYLLTGDENDESTFGLFLMKVHAKTGRIQDYASYYLSGRESANHSIMVGSNIYCAGRYGLQRKEDKYRGAVSMFDVHLKEKWSKYYLTPRGKYARNYLAKIKHTGESIVAAFFTNNMGISKNYTLSVAELSMNGDLKWANEYVIEGYESITVRDIAICKGGYLLYGYTDLPAQDLFLMKIDKEGNHQWTHIYGGVYSDFIMLDEGKYMHVEKNNAYFIAQSRNVTSEHDYTSILMSKPLENNADSLCWQKTVMVNTLQYESPIEGVLRLSEYGLIPNEERIQEKTLMVDWGVDEYVCYPYLTSDDYDTIKSTTLQTQIDVLNNDMVVVGSGNYTIELLKNPQHGTAYIEDSVFVYVRANEYMNACVKDSFQYTLQTTLPKSDTATVYITTEMENPITDTIVLPLHQGVTLKMSQSQNNVQYKWSTGDTSEQLYVENPGEYIVYAEGAQCLYSKKYLVEENPYSFESVLPNNMVLLLDVSLSMSQEERLPLLKKTLLKLITYMRTEDEISMVAYADSAEVILHSVSAKEEEKIKEGINELSLHGKTKVVLGIEKAIKILLDNYNEEKNNRIILLTDGKIFYNDKNELVLRLKELEPLKNTYFTIFLFNTGTMLQEQMYSLAQEMDGKSHQITPENIEAILLKEFKLKSSVPGD